MSCSTYSRPVVSCGQCDSCKSGDTSLCDTQIGLIGYNRPGGMAPYVNVPIENIHIVPESIPRQYKLPSSYGTALLTQLASLSQIVDVAALAEPLSVAWHAVECSDLKPGETALVCGAGPVGALIAR